MSAIDEVTELIEKQGKAQAEFQAVQIKRIDEMDKALLDLEKRAGRPRATDGTAAGAKHEVWIDAKSGKNVAVLKPNEQFSALAERSADTPTFGRVLRGLVCGSYAPDAAELAAERKSMNLGTDPAGGFMIEGQVANEWVDLLRARSVLTRAGARTIEMPSGQFGIAKIDTDPTVSWHGESAAITATQPVLGRVNLTARTAVCVIPFSVELLQDAGNLEQQLSGLVTRALAGALDSAGLIGADTGSAAAPTGLINTSGRGQVTSIGAIANHDFLIDGLYTLMAANASAENAALIANPNVWQDLAKLRTGITNDLTPLRPPEEIAKLPKLWTMSMPTTTGIVADFSDVIIGLRKSLTIKLTDSRLASNLDGTLVAYLRADVACVRAGSLVTLEGIS